MFTPDYCDRTYTAEVIKCKSHVSDVVKSVLKLAIDVEIENRIDEANGAAVKLYHAFLPTKRDFHRFPRILTLDDGTKLSVPRQKIIRSENNNLYDLLIAECGNHIIIGVPFYQLAESFFVRVDRAIGGMGAEYEKLDITELVIKLGEHGSKDPLVERGKKKIGLSITRCHLNYSEQETRALDLQQVTLTGANLGASREYKSLISPVLKPETSKFSATPVVLGLGNPAYTRLRCTMARQGGRKTHGQGRFYWLSA